MIKKNLDNERGGWFIDNIYICPQSGEHGAQSWNLPDSGKMTKAQYHFLLEAKKFIIAIIAFFHTCLKIS